MTYASAKAHKLALEAECVAASRAMQAFPKGPLGLTPDLVKASPEYRRARHAYSVAAESLQAFNAGFMRQWAKEYRADMIRERESRAGMAR